MNYRSKIFLFFLLIVSVNGFGQCVNVALNKPATSSSNYNTTAAGAFDGNCTTVWNSGGYSGWVQVDLQGTYTINNINLLVNQSPTGNTVHEIYKAATIAGPWTLVETLSGSTSSFQLIQRCYSAAPLTNVGAIRINTVSSPSWVSWYDIGVFASSSSTGFITASGPLSFCQGGSVTLTASPGTSYLWSNGATTQSITVTSSGTYNVTINGAGAASCVNGNQTCTNCNSTTASTTVTVLPNQTVSIQSSASNPICSGETVTLTAQGATTYAWNTGATNSEIQVSPTLTTSYSVTGTGANGCTGSASVNLVPVDTLTWVGAVDNDWHKACNWSPEYVPRCCNPVKIPLTTNQPTVAGVAATKDLSIFSSAGALLTVNDGANLQVQNCPVTTTTNSCPSLAVLTTTAVSSIAQTTAVSGGSITYQGASAITARGICWGTSPNPTIANSITSNGTGIGTFTSNLTGLVAGTTYYVRAYATNGSGTSYGNQVIFTSTAPLAVGQTYQGGVVAYLFAPGDPCYVAGQQHGIIAAPADQGQDFWNCYAGTYVGVFGTALCQGGSNTNSLYGACSTQASPIKTCYDLVLNGYTDWVLPSSDELSKLYINRATIGGFSAVYYWSSSEYPITYAWAINFSNGVASALDKFSVCRVRAIRYF
jgi:hypothetical protein